MDLNEKQSIAVGHGTGPCLVLAGPGSGKTMTIVGRILNLLNKEKVKPDEILVITFTKYAAKEMKQRFYRVSSGIGESVTFGTFHGVFYGILRDAYRFTNSNIFTEKEKYQLLGEILSKETYEFPVEEDFLKDVLADISTVKNSGLDVNTYQAKSGSNESFQRIFGMFEQCRKDIRKIDFDDMLVLCYELLSTRTQVLRKWQKRFRYILVDEFQDINKVQYEVLKLLAKPEDNVFVVGDDDQSIYGFRGASAKLVFQFKKDFPTAKEVVLNVNYRSTKNIIQRAAKVIGHNRERLPKKIVTPNGLGENIHIHESKEAADEAKFVVREVRKRMKQGVAAEDIAVLYRVHEEVGPLVEQLVESKIPFQIKEKLKNIYEHYIGQDMQSYFRLCQGERKRCDFLRVMNRPLRYFGRDALLCDPVEFESIRNFYKERAWMQDRVDGFEWDLKMMEDMSPYAAIRYIRKKIGYDDFLREQGKTSVNAYAQAVEILDQIEAGSKNFITLKQWLAHVQAYAQFLEYQHQKSVPKEGIHLLTIHGAKGLEFDTVFMLAANEGVIPYKRAIADNLEEERRLFYVAMTRAKEMLHISYINEKNGNDLSPSRFVDELY
ncbi:MAG: ATP-dependent helicase [Lachnospiraceae bacterium]|nr:ATP-dependent helicase [Lachnospiraceae bacterium]